ncbi:unnamed protein product [Spirodela intermedia]|uniref:Uncharacterized protein n=1 Tax=Spirodela intermedia TaxID=51605 RepID=A0A7I8JW54_SPIIN|nr:unnamed protein product [Spirodela intermedia]
MREFPSCFGESGVQVADSSGGGATGKHGQNLVTCVYRTPPAGRRRRPCSITVAWSKTMTGRSFSLQIEDTAAGDCLWKIDIKPWLFSGKKGSKSTAAEDGKIELFWDLSAAKFAGGGPEPLSGFYLAVVFDAEMALLLGDRNKEAYRRTGGATPTSGAAACVWKKEHLFGKRVFSTAARFSAAGQPHEIAIECDAAAAQPPVGGPSLEIRIDRRRAVEVKRLAWKFRGNQTILVDGVPVEVFWDVHRWLFGGGAPANAVFMFQSSTAGAAEKPSPLPEKKPRAAAFSLVLHAWRTE